MKEAKIENKNILIWERENPTYKRLVESDSNKELLEWASKKKYISLQNPVPGLYYYSPFELEVAQMWAEKEGEHFGKVKTI